MNIKRKGQLPSVPRNKTQGEYTKKYRYSKSPAIKHLEMMALEAVKKKYPMIPYPVVKKYRDDTATGLTVCVIDFLKLSSHQAERINCTGRPIDQRKTFTDFLGHRRTIGRMKWIPGTGTKGTADISAVIGGLSVKIEIKVGTDRQSPAQKDYQAAIEQAGGIYLLIRSFQQFYEWYNQTFPQ